MEGITNRQVVARAAHLAVVLSLVIDSSIHAGEKLIQGQFLAKQANGKYRAYAEAEVTTAFGAASTEFAVDPAGPMAKHFRVGDVIESTTGTALGTIATYNPATGVGTLAANSANALAIGQNIRIAESVASLGTGKGRLLAEKVEMGLTDEVASGYAEGFMVKTSYTTDAAVTKVGTAYDSPQGAEFKMKL